MTTVQEADVCLIVEGTYPFVTGGVSSWIHELLQGMPDLTFSILHIAPSRGYWGEPRYKLPPNVVSFLECYAHDPMVHRDRCPGWSFGAARRIWKALDAFHNEPLDHKLPSFEQLMRGYACPATRVLNTNDLLLSRKAWQYLLGRYERKGAEISFIDFFWTWRSVHMPLFQVINAETPPAKVYHAVSTGYAGLAGVVAKLRTGRPLVLHEHGIYVRERKIEIEKADWVYTAPERVVTVKTTPGVLKEIWIDNFIVLGKLCYDYADLIVTSHADNQRMQVEHGADRSKLYTIPNGVKMEVFGPLRDVPRPNDGIRRVGFVGRVVPIKDVKCFIKAAKLCADTIPNVQFLIIGPTDEDEPYFRECESLAALLSMQEKISFLGRVNVKEYYPKLDVAVLTSISEGQPLTVLEAMCAGVPNISTDVGSCSELLLGREGDDRSLGESGIITNLGQPAETAAALVKILSNEPLRQSMIQAGFRRIEAYYRQDRLHARYKEVYRRYIAAPNADWRAG